MKNITSIIFALVLSLTAFIAAFGQQPNIQITIGVFMSRCDALKE